MAMLYTGLVRSCGFIMTCAGDPDFEAILAEYRTKLNHRLWGFDLQFWLYEIDNVANGLSWVTQQPHSYAHIAHMLQYSQLVLSAYSGSDLLYSALTTNTSR